MNLQGAFLGHSQLTIAGKQTTAGAALAGAAAAAAAIAGRLSGEGAMRRSNSSASMDSVARKKSKWDSASLLGGVCVCACVPCLRRGQP